MTFPPEWFYNACNQAYHTVTSAVPEPVGEAIRNRPEATAGAMGFTAAYATVYGIEQILKHFLGSERTERLLPLLENLGLASAAIVPFATAAIDPKGIRDLLQTHPVYTSGCVGLIAGSVARALQDLGALQPLEDELKQFWEKFKKE